MQGKVANFANSGRLQLIHIETYFVIIELNDCHLSVNVMTLAVSVLLIA